MGSVVEELETTLAAGQVDRTEATLSRYAVDQAPILDYQLPLAVVFPESVADVQAVVKICAAGAVPIVPRGAGTGVSGGAHATKDCIILSLERMDRILQLNPDDETAVVIIEHTMHAMLRLSDMFLVLDHGCVIASGEPNRVVQEPAVIEAYLGKKWMAENAVA